MYKRQLLQSAKLARKYHVRLHTHLAETKDEERYTLDRYGLRPLAYLESLGWVDVYKRQDYECIPRAQKAHGRVGAGRSAAGKEDQEEAL